MSDTLIGLTGWVGQNPEVVCGGIESLTDIGRSSTGVLVRDMALDSTALTMLRHSDITI